MAARIDKNARVAGRGPAREPRNYALKLTMYMQHLMTVNG